MKKVCAVMIALLAAGVLAAEDPAAAPAADTAPKTDAAAKKGADYSNYRQVTLEDIMTNNQTLTGTKVMVRQVILNNNIYVLQRDPNLLRTDVKNPATGRTLYGAPYEIGLGDLISAMTQTNSVVSIVGTVYDRMILIEDVIM